MLNDRIKSRRLELNMTQEELALKVGYKTKGAISRIENGDRDISQSQITAFAKALNTTEAYLMGWEETSTDILTLPPTPKHSEKEEFSIEDLPEFFETATEAKDFVFNKTRVFGFNGLDVTKLSDDELLMYANSILSTVKMLSRRLNK